MKLNISRKMKIIIPIVLVVVVGSTYMFLHKKKVEVKQNIKNVKTVAVESTSLYTEVEYASKLKGFQEIAISPKMPGKVATLNVKVGDHVEKGQVLFTLDSSELRAQVEQSQAGVDSSNANYAKTKDSVSKQQVIQVEQNYKTCQITYNDSKTNYEKTKELFDSGYSSQQELDNAQSRFSNAAINLTSATDNYNVTKDKLVPQTIQSSAADVERSQAALNYSRVQLDNTTITSPITGTVAAVNIDEGELTSSATPSINVIDAKTLIAEANVPDKMLAKIKVGDTINVKVSALEDKAISGVIDSISPAADSKTQAYTVKIKIDNTSGDLKPGMFSKVMLPAEKKENVLALPNEAIKSENGTAFIYTVVEGKVKKMPVTVGLSNSKVSEIISDSVKKGYKVITEGQIFLNDGEKVNQ